jgi:glycerophosphoryl diester phosphodiesterase
MQLIAHRGASHLAPENTLAAVRLGWRERADGVEVDIQLTADRRVVVIHDANARRVTGRNWRVDRRRAAELRRLDAGSWKGPRWRGERIPLLEEVLAATPRGGRLYLDVKFGPAIAGPLRRAVAKAGFPPRRLVFMSEFLSTLAAIRRVCPGAPTYWIVALNARRGSAAGRRRMIRRAVGAGLTGLGLNCCRWLNPALVRAMGAAGLTLYVWTVDNERSAARMRALGAVALATNRPARLRRNLERQSG